MKASFKLILFDLDGTLIDTLEDLAEAVNHALDARGLPLHSLEEYRQMVGHGVRNLVKQALEKSLQAAAPASPAGAATPAPGAAPAASAAPAVPDSLVDDALADFKAWYTAHIDVHTRPYPGMQELVSDLDAAGVRMAVVSNKFQSGTEKLVREFFPGIPFVAILGNREGFPLKPDPEIVAEVLRVTGLSREDALLVGDSGTDMQTAANGGIAAVAVGWGYRPMGPSADHGFAANAGELRAIVLK